MIYDFGFAISKGNYNWRMETYRAIIQEIFVCGLGK